MALFNFSLLFLFSTLSPISSQAHLHLLSEKRSYDGGGDRLFCDSWRLSVETGNAGYWGTIPSECVNYVAGYMNGKHYLSDSEVAAWEALAFARTVPVAGDGKDVWVFDIDETLLSNLPFYRDCGYGLKPYNETAWDEWVFQGKAPALPASLKLYEELQGLGFQLVLLTGRPEDQRAVTEQNLLFSGFCCWERLILRGPSDHGTTAVVFKSGKRAELVAQGYRIHGNSGDQWSDLLGSPMATRSFKLPNPMYHIP